MKSIMAYNQRHCFVFRRAGGWNFGVLFQVPANLLEVDPIVTFQRFAGPVNETSPTTPARPQPQPQQSIGDLS